MKLNKAEFSLIVCEMCIFGIFALALFMIIGATVEFTTGYELLP